MPKYTLQEQLKDKEQDVKDAKKALKQDKLELKMVSEYIRIDTKNLFEAQKSLEKFKKDRNL